MLFSLLAYLVLFSITTQTLGAFIGKNSTTTTVLQPATGANRFVNHCWPAGPTSTHVPVVRSDCEVRVTDFLTRPNAKQIINFATVKTDPPFVIVPKTFKFNTCVVKIIVFSKDFPWTKSDESSWWDIGVTVKAILDNCMMGEAVHLAGVMSTGILDRIGVFIDGKDWGEDSQNVTGVAGAGALDSDGVLNASTAQFSRLDIL